MSLPVGTRLGSYEIIAALGAGGMGEVYRAHDARLGRDVAVKVLHDDVSSLPERRARFEREARVVARLNHPNIVTLFSIEEAAGIRFLTMELVEGRSLAELVTGGGLPLAQVLDLTIPLADALAAAHAMGVVHRDLKPTNVMVTLDGRVKVLDFGLAKLVRPESNQQPASATSSPLSATGEVLGTVPYMSPEQVFGEAVDERTDLFSLGIVIFEIVAGHRPFAGKTFWEVTAAIMRDEPPPLTSVRPDVPADFGRIVSRCLAKEPADRFQTALDVAIELRALKRVLERGTAPAAAPAVETIASVAVLPFVNRSANVDDGYFSDGLADELLNLLAKIKGLRVSARASSFHFRDKSVPLVDVGRALKVDTIVDGSVRRAGNRVRISVQLVKVVDGYHLWSETYDRTLDDIFAVQDDIARSVVKELRATLLGEVADSAASDRAKVEVGNAAKGRSTNAEAHRLYLLGRHFMDQFTWQSTAKAIDCLEKAVEQDPGFALAWTELSVAYAREINWTSTPAAEGYARSKAAAERSIALEPALAETHTQIAWIRIFHEWNWRGAEASLARALELAPGSASILRLSGALASVLGRPNEAIGIVQRALEQDPLSAAVYHSLGLFLHVVDDFAGAADAFRRALDLAPQRITTHARLAINALAWGRPEEALSAAMREPDAGFRLWALAIVYHTQGNEAESESALRRLIDVYAEGWALQVAEVYAARGEVDDAFDWLDRAHAKRDTGLPHLLTDPRLRSLHEDPRWMILVSRMGLAQSPITRIPI
ncbi:MAG: protein kinase [Gemmatimonadaceae bacterium]